jgi:hypothetical protein
MPDPRPVGRDFGPQIRKIFLKGRPVAVFEDPALFPLLVLVLYFSEAFGAGRIVEIEEGRLRKRVGRAAARGMERIAF